MSDEQRFFKHPQALVESSRIGAGTRIWAFAHVMNGAHVGEHCNLCDHVYVDPNVRIGNHVTVKNGVALWDGVVIEDYVFVGPNAVFTNDRNPRAAVRKDRSEFLPTLIRYGASIGANATVVCGVTIGRFAFVGAGAVVTHNIQDYVIAVGVPAVMVGYMCECGATLPSSMKCSCGLVYVKNGRGGLTAATVVLAHSANQSDE